MRMESQLKSISFEDSKVNCVRFIKQSHMIVAHNKSISVLSVKDNFTQRSTFAPST